MLFSGSISGVKGTQGRKGYKRGMGDVLLLDKREKRAREKEGGGGRRGRDTVM